jgi:tetratricopeptide (TPR) repeat protein
VEGNLGVLYERERWPEVFFEVLRVYQRAYPHTRAAEKLEDRLLLLLNDNAVPYVLAYLLRLPDSGISWNVDFFKNRALQCEMAEDFAGAVSYCDLCLKLDPANSGVYAIRGRLLDDMERHDEAEAMYRKAVELNDTNHIAWHALARHSSQTDPKTALEQIERAISLADSEATYYATKSKLLLRLDDFDGALENCDKAIELAPLDAEYVYEKAELLMQDGKDVAAIALYRKAIGLDDKHLPTLWRLARFYGEDQPDMAIGYVNTILSLEPQNQDAKLAKGTMLMRLGETAAALDEFKQLMGIDPQCHEALAGFAAILLDEDPETALSYYERAIALSPQNAGYRSGKARALERLGDTSAAIREYRAVIALDKTDARAFARLGALLAPAKPKEAIDFYTRAIACAPENAYYLVCKAELLSAAPNGRAEAFACYLKAAELDPNNARLHVIVAGFLEEDGNAASAVEHYRHAVALDPNSAEVFYRLARLTFESDPESALLYVNSAISLGEKDIAGCYYIKARVLAAIGEKEQALDFLGQAIALSPKNPEYIVARGDILLGAGQFEKALEQYRLAASIDSKNAAATLGIARCLDALGDSAALGAYEKAALLAVEPDSAAAIPRLGFLLRESEPREALALLDRAIADNPAGLLLRMWRGDALRKLGDKAAAKREYEAAAEFCQEALRKGPQNASLRLMLGKLLLELEDPAAALGQFKAAAALDAKNHEALERLAVLLLQQGELGAEAALDAALETAPNCPICLYEKAKVLDAKEADAESIIALLDAALKTKPDFTEARRLLVELLRKKRSFIRLAIESRKLKQLTMNN